MKNLNKNLSLFEDIISISFFLIGFLLMMYEVIMRYIFNHPTSWINEISTVIVVWGVLLGLSLTLRDGRHIRVDLLYVLMPPFFKKLIDYFSNLVGVLFCLVFTYYGMVIVIRASNSGQLSVETSIPMWVYYLIIPLSGLMFLIRFFENIVKVKNSVATESELDLILNNNITQVEKKEEIQ